MEPPEVRDLRCQVFDRIRVLPRRSVRLGEAVPHALRRVRDRLPEDARLLCACLRLRVDGAPDLSCGGGIACLRALLLREDLRPNERRRPSGIRKALIEAPLELCALEALVEREARDERFRNCSLMLHVRSCLLSAALRGTESSEEHTSELQS